MLAETATAWWMSLNLTPPTTDCADNLPFNVTVITLARDDYSFFLLVNPHPAAKCWVVQWQPKCVESVGGSESEPIAQFDQFNLYHFPAHLHSKLDVYFIYRPVQLPNRLQ